MRELTVGIIGAGTAGPAAAAFLARDGHHVTLFEQASPLRPVGAGLLLQPTGLAVLDDLGLKERMLGLGHRIDRLSGCNQDGTAVLGLLYNELGDGFFGLTVHRGALFESLMSVLDPMGVCVRAGVRIGSLHHTSTGVTLRSSTGESFGPFDLVVIADGARSSLRDEAGIRTTATPYPWGAMWCVLPRTDDHFDHTLVQHYEGTGRMLGFLPIGKASSGPEGVESIAVFWSIPVTERSTFLEAGCNAWHRAASALCPHAAPMFAHVSHTDQFIFANYSDVHTPEPWLGRIVVLGDAAHATSPQLGQGANLALIDARELATAVDESPSLADAAAMYAASRRRHLRFYRWASRLLTPWFQSSMESLAPVRDAVFPIAARVPWVRQQMALSLAGVKDGLFSRRPLKVPSSAP